ncbi:MAG TPA: hypothetical protein VJH65_01460 [Candidatus Nanoarchaeia archaeon]|nr:hypothetical protein [Candidatus Nanoarchaeia archaeon]
MTTLERVMQMRSQGMKEGEIVNTLQQEGISPKEIKDSIEQAQIKQAISNSPLGEEIVPSLEESPTEEYKGAEEPYIPAPSTDTAGAGGYPQEVYGAEAYEGYAQQPASGAAGYYDSASVIEISEQVFTEKIQKIQKRIDEMAEFKIITQAKLDNLSERLKKIESIIDKLQISILEEVGSYGKNLDKVQKEIDMVQESFAKIVEPLAEHAEQTRQVKIPSIKKQTAEKTHKKIPSGKRKASKRR